MKIGLGKRGYPLALNMKDNGHEVIAYNRNKDKRERIEAEGVKTVDGIEKLIDSLHHLKRFG